MMLGDLGATVLKVERPGTGDDTRVWGPPYDDAGEATYFQAVNRNKSSIALDLRRREDLAKAEELIVDSDVVVENFRPGVMDRLGLGYERLREQNAKLIYCSINGFGSGRGARLAGYDLLVQALGGLMSITGEPDGDPQKVGVAIVDVLAGLFATVGILAAVNHRMHGGEGQHIEVDLLSSLLASLVNQGTAYTIAGVVPARMGNAHPSIAPYELLATASGGLVLAVGTDRQFATLCRILGEERLATEGRFRTNSDRVAHRAQLRSELEGLLLRGTAQDWARKLTAAGVPAGLVNDIPAAFALAESLGLEPIVSIPRASGSPARLTRNPIRLSQTPARYDLPPPRLPRGESCHSRA